jgi:hypothetical protein
MTTDWAASRSGISRSHGSGCGFAAQAGSPIPSIVIASNTSLDAGARVSPAVLEVNGLWTATSGSLPCHAVPVPQHRSPWEFGFEIMHDYYGNSRASGIVNFDEVRGAMG